MQQILVLDFETTGLQAGHHEPVQVAAILLDAGHPELPELGFFESRIRPLYPERAEAKALEVHGLTLAELARAPHPGEVFARLEAFAAQAGIPIIAGHNIDFDMRFLAAAEAAHGFKLPRHKLPPYCTCNAARRHLQRRGKTANAKLGTVAAHYGITFNAHDTLGDIRATAEVMRRFLKEAPELLRGYVAAEAPGFLYAPLQPTPAPEQAPAPEPAEEGRAPEASASFAESLMLDLRTARAVEAECRRELEYLPEYQAWRVAEERVSQAHEALKCFHDGTTGVAETRFGKVGYQVRRTVTHSVDAVRELVPELAPLVVVESVNKTELEKRIKAAVKLGDLPADTIALLEERAEVKETNVWICQPVEAEEGVTA